MSAKPRLGLRGLDEVRNIINQRILRRDVVEEYTLDADATEITGEKEEAFFTYKGDKGYMPMLGFLYEAQLCIYDEFREGNVPPAFDQRGFYLECKKRMPSGKRIGYYRADSASYQTNLINELESDGIHFTITADQDVAVKRIIASIADNEWIEPEEGCGYKLADTVHCMEKTINAFRLVIKREKRRQKDLFNKGEEPHFYYVVATSWLEENKDSYQVLKWHNQRGQAEELQ